ncbi:uncharacterized protein LOC135120816 [Zophobas morio]|uniref:uncharacterized protein LOC135120816 n=1 Tax=Zophobas morio TaxID=2755281 RepID=UPI003083D4BB
MFEVKKILETDLLGLYALKSFKLKMENIAISFYEKIYEKLSELLYLEKEDSPADNLKSDSLKLGEEKDEDEEVSIISQHLLEHLSKAQVRTSQIEKMLIKITPKRMKEEQLFQILLESLNLVGYLKESILRLEQQRPMELSRITSNAEIIIREKKLEL